MALVHDWLVTRGGAERVLEALVDLLGRPPIYTLVYRREAFTGSPISECVVHTSALQRLPGAVRHYQRLLPFMPHAMEQFDLSAYDLVISSSHAVAKGVLTRVGQVHVAYVHTPMRYAWDLYHAYQRTVSPLLRPLAAATLHYLRLWDVASSARPDVLVANSQYVARRIWRTYRRHARVIHPPVDVERFWQAGEVSAAVAEVAAGGIAPSLPAGRPAADGASSGYFVTHGRLVDYKRVDLLVAAFNRTGLPLLVIGDGPERRRLESMARANVRFAGWQEDDAVRALLQGARAYVFAADEDFGIAPVEAQAAGLPVLAYGRGGARETVVDGVTGLFFSEPTVESVLDGLARFAALEPAFDRDIIRRHARRFSVGRFQEEIRALLQQALCRGVAWGCEAGSEWAPETAAVTFESGGPGPARAAGDDEP